jgi:hypothetical protein
MLGPDARVPTPATPGSIRTAGEAGAAAASVAAGEISASAAAAPAGSSGLAIVFAIAPHIIRLPPILEANTRAIDIGTGSSIELRREPVAAAQETPKWSAPSDQAPG